MYVLNFLFRHLPYTRQKYFLSSGQIIPKRPLTPPISNQRVGIVTQHTIHRPHSPHSAQHLLILLSTSFQRFISNEQFFACFKVGPCRNGIRHQRTFRWGGGPPKENLKKSIHYAPRCCTQFRKDVNHLKPASGCKE